MSTFPASLGQRFSNNTCDVSQSPTGSLWEIKNEQNQKDASLVLRKVKGKTIQRSESMGNNKSDKKGSMLSRLKAEQREEHAMSGKKSYVCKEEQSEKSEVPFITLQSELSLDARRLLVAQALAVDLFLDGEKEHKNKVLAWQVTGT